MNTVMTIILAAGLGMGPLVGAAPEVTGGPPVVLAGGCHSGIRTHYVPEFGDVVRHRHRSDCSPVLARGGDRRDDRRDRRTDCHRDIRTHRIGGQMVTHRHVGDDCRVREVRGSTTIAPD